MAGSQAPAPIVLWDHTRGGIRWRVSIHPEIVREGVQVVRFLKRGKTRKLLDQFREWGPQGWICPPSAKVPMDLIERIERELQRRIPPSGPSAAGGTRPSIHRVTCRGAGEAIRCGGMSFSAFLALDLVEAWLPDPYRRKAYPQLP
jgi:hypothetical protein